MLPTEGSLLHRRPDRPRVVRIVLVAAHEGPHHLRRQKPDLVTELPDPAPPNAASRRRPPSRVRGVMVAMRIRGVGE